MRQQRVWCTVLAWSLFLNTTFAADWTWVADKIIKSVVIVETDHGLCTGFVINPSYKDDKETVTLILTAAHCAGEQLYADQEPAKIKWKDEKRDLLIVQIGETDRPALRLAKDDPKVGEIVASLGFGYGTVVDKAMFRIAHVSASNLFIATNGIGGPLIATDATFVAGQSGGPVVNEAGDVVMIVQMGTASVGMGVGAETIKSKTGKYWEKQKPAKP